MCFAGHVGASIDLQKLAPTPSEQKWAAVLFSEELGALLQVRKADVPAVLAAFEVAGLGGAASVIGSLRADDRVVVTAGVAEILNESRVSLQQAWSETSYQMQKRRDNPRCAEEEYAQILDSDDPGLNPVVTFDAAKSPARALIESSSERPRVAILREQGVNGQVEMAAAFHAVGFSSRDVHMSDLLAGRVKLEGFSGLVACGGFSYGDVLGAGLGWAKSILFHEQVRAELAQFFHRPSTFTLGVCNGCQAFSALKELMPGADHFPRFVRNESEQFEARLSQVELLPSPSIFLKEMVGTRIPVAVAHGEGRADFSQTGDRARVNVALRFVDGRGQAALSYPKNPNGSPDGITGVTSDDGRVTLLMPHPERVFRAVQHSYCPEDWEEKFGGRGPWMRMFESARAFVG
jgi:phosphoribosylformylglycinamidine synthase